MKKIILSLLLILLMVACSTTDNTSVKRTLVIISDFHLGSDLIIKIYGAVRNRYPDIEIQFFPAAPFDIKEAAYNLEVAVKNYPAGTFFICIVEPGAIGKKMVFRTDDNKKILVADNGLASRIIKYFPTFDFYYVDNQSIFDGKQYNEVSFEEYYTKATIALISDIPMKNLGSAVTNPVIYQIQEAVNEEGVVKGEILFNDDFGNCISNISSDIANNFQVGDILKIVADDKVAFYSTVGTNYGSVPNNENVCFFNSSKRLEIAANYGNISQRYGISAGTKLRITKATVRVGILLYNQSPVVLDIVSGMKNRMQELGFKEGINTLYNIKNANGDKASLKGLIDELLADGIDIIVPISTPASQSAVQFVPDSIPIIFSYVTDPQSAGILDVRKGVSGLSDATNFIDYMNFIIELFPNLKKAGTIYNNTESNSIYAQQQLKKQTNLLSIDLIQYPIINANDINTAYNQLKSQDIKIILIVADNTMSNEMKTLSNLALPEKISVIGDSYQHAKDGALASISVDYDALARGTGDLVASVIRGINPDSQKIKTFSTNVVAINTQTAMSIGYTFSESIIQRAKYIFP
ncbi:MAG: SAM-dependent chlorinase/fluorinase [Candidatus Woesearchaeota archaeon]